VAGLEYSRNLQQFICRGPVSCQYPPWSRGGGLLAAKRILAPSQACRFA